VSTSTWLRFSIFKETLFPHVRGNMQFTFLCMAYFALHHNLQFLSFFADFTLSDWITHHCVRVSCFFIHSCVDGHIDWVLDLAVVSGAC
jgi:hypothetical protein